MDDWYIDEKLGLGSFQSLESKFGIKNYVTYDDRIWGNMLGSFENDEASKDEIVEKDLKLARLLGTNTLFSMTTPPEDTFIHFENNSHRLLVGHRNPDIELLEKRIRANSIIIDPDINEDFEVVFAPADCAIVILVHSNWKGLVIMHLGLPQLFQMLHKKTTRYLHALIPEIDIKEFSAYVTPYICGEHYSIDEGKYKALQGTKSGKELLSYSKKIFHDRLEEERHFIDIGSYLRDYFTKELKLKSYAESGICTYEESESGKLFSHRLEKELAYTGDNSYKRGRYNVAIKYPGAR